MNDVIGDGIALRAHGSLDRGGVTNDDNDNGIDCKYTASKCDYTVLTYLQWPKQTHFNAAQVWIT